MSEHSPKIVLYDLETLPILPEALKVWTQLSNYPGLTFKASINSIICFGWKILGESKTHVISAWDFPEWLEDVNNDRPLLEKAIEILSDADGIITQNGKKFDEKFLQTRLLLRGMDTLPKLKHVDTKILAGRFSFFSNSLKYLAEQLTERRKIENEGWNLWCRVHRRDTEACAEMAEYCKGDIDALEAIFKRLRSAASGANTMPNQNLFVVGGSKNLCPNCGSTRLVSNGTRTTMTRSYRRYRCVDCGASSSTDLTDKMPRPI